MTSQAMTERNREIDMHKAMLRAQCKAMESERQTTRFVYIIFMRGGGGRRERMSE